MNQRRPYLIQDVITDHNTLKGGKKMQSRNLNKIYRQQKSMPMGAKKEQRKKMEASRTKFKFKGCGCGAK